MSVLQLIKTLDQAPEITACSSVTVRHYLGDQDIEPWLALRRAAFARERLGVRDWTRADFEAEFLSRWWWRPENMWLAETVPSDDSDAANEKSTPALIGTVTLAFRGDEENAVPAVHWLAVHPGYRRRGIARHLLAHLEAAVWQLSLRQIFLETHDAWSSAAHLYRSLGYLPAANRRTASG